MLLGQWRSGHWADPETTPGAAKSRAEIVSTCRTLNRPLQPFGSQYVHQQDVNDKCNWVVEIMTLKNPAQSLAHGRWPINVRFLSNEPQFDMNRSAFQQSPVSSEDSRNLVLSSAEGPQTHTDNSFRENHLSKTGRYKMVSAGRRI